MGKDGGFLTAKAISKRIKAKGLGRLRWYCQMCEKQCRDENGFKCHTQSAGHQRQLGLFAENPSHFITNFSSSFRVDFLSVLRQRYGNAMVHINTVYQDYIKDRDHIHMNATQWTTLSDFVKDLGKEGHCKVEELDDGFWIAFLDRQVAEKNRHARERDTLLLQEDHRAEQVLQAQILAAKTANLHNDSAEAEVDEPQPAHAALTPLQLSLSNLSRRNMIQTRTSSLEHNALQLLSNRQQATVSGNPFNAKPSRWGDANGPVPAVVEDNKHQSLVSISAMPKQQQAIPEDPPPWLHNSIIVKVKNNDVEGGSFFGKKGKVVNVIEDFGARVEILDSHTVLELDQDDLETVIPKAGGVVLLLRGPRRGQKAVIKSINVDEFNVTVTMLETGEQLENVEYEMVSRVSS